MSGHKNLDNWRNHQINQRTHNLVMGLIGFVLCLTVVGSLAVGYIALKLMEMT